VGKDAPTILRVRRYATIILQPGVVLDPGAQATELMGPKGLLANMRPSSRFTFLDS
jgi:hypothetical protein